MLSIQNFNRTLDIFATPTKRVLGAILMTLVLCSNSGYGHAAETKTGHQGPQLIPGETLGLKILINHLMNLLDPTSQSTYSITSSLENDALLLISTYQASELSPTLSPAEVTEGLEDCKEAQIILNDPGSEVELSTSTAMNLEATIASIREDLENVY